MKRHQIYRVMLTPMNSAVLEDMLLNLSKHLESLDKESSSKQIKLLADQSSLFALQ